MKILLFITLLISTLNIFSQLDSINQKQLYIIQKVDCSLSEEWICDELTYSESFNSLLTIPTYNISLFSYKNLQDDTNLGIGIYIFSKSDSDKVKKYDWTRNLGELKIIETNTLIIVVGYKANWHETYNKMIKIAVPEIVSYFEKNKENL